MQQWMRKTGAGIASDRPPRLTSRKPGKTERPAEAEGAQPALAGLPPGLAAEARPAVVQTAGTTRPSEFARAGSRRTERSAVLVMAVRHIF